MTQSLYKKIVQDVGIISILGMTTSISGILLLPIITKILGVQDYGIYVQFSVTLALIIGITTLGLPYATVRFLAGEKNREKIIGEVWSTVLIILLASILVTAVMMLFSRPIANLLFGGLISVVIVLAFLIPIESISTTLQNLFRVFQLTKHYTVFNVMKTYVELGIVIFLILSGFGIVEVVLSIFIIRLLFLVIIVGIMKHLIGLGKPVFSAMKEYFTFGSPTIPSQLASWINDSSDRYVIAIFLGVAAVGYYNPGYALGTMLLLFSAPFDFVLVSIVAEYYNKGEIELVRNIFEKAIKYYLLLAIPCFFGLSILAKPLLTILSTPEIASQSYLITPIVAFSMLFSGIGAVATGKSMYLANKNHISMINWFFVASINIILCIVLVPKMGIMGAALATLASFSFGFVFGTYYACKYFNFSVDWGAIAKTLFASVVMSTVILFIKPVTVLGIILTIIIGMVVYFAILYATKTFDKKETSLIKSLIKR